MTEKLDKLSMLLGEIKADIENLDDKFDNNIPVLYKKIEEVEKDFSNYKIKAAYTNGGIAAVIALVFSFLKDKIFG